MKKENKFVKDQMLNDWHNLTFDERLAIVEAAILTLEHGYCDEVFDAIYKKYGQDIHMNIQH